MPIITGGSGLSGGPIVTNTGSGTRIVPEVILPTRFFPAPGDLGGGSAASTERREFTYGASTSKRAIIYGRDKVGGDVFAVANDATSGVITLGVAIGEGEINAVEGTDAYGGTGAPWISYDHKLGVKTPSADTTFQAALNGSVEVYPFLAWSRVAYNTGLLGGAIEFPKFIVQGLKIYDPRENYLTYSEDYTASYWTFTGTTPTISTKPGLSQADTTSAYDYAGRWVWGASGSNAASRTTSGLGLVASDSLTVSIDMRTISGTATVTLDATKVTGSVTSSTSCALTTTWTRFSATVTAGAGGTGEGRLKIRDIATSSTIEIGRAQIEKNSEPYGYKKTTSATVVPIVEYSANPALEMADLKSNIRYGQRVGISVTVPGAMTLNDLRAFWDRSGTKGTFDIVIDGTGPNTFKWRFTPLGGTTGSYTTGVAITKNAQLLSNGLYIRIPTTTGHTLNDAWSITTPPVLIDWASVGLAAEYCDEVLSNGDKRWECHIAIKEPARLEEWEKTIGLHFAGKWQFSDGQWKMVVHKPTSTIAYAVTSATIIAGSCKLKRGSNSGVLDSPNQMSATWIDPTDDWKEKHYTVNSVETDTTEIREGQSYALIGCQKEHQARRTLTYLFNGVLADLVIEFDGLLVLSTLIPGDKISVVYDPVGLSSIAYFTVTSVVRDDQRNSVHISATLYSSSIWSDVVGATDTIGTFLSINPFDTPPEVSTIQQSTTNSPLRLYWNKPVAFKTDTLYPTGSWAQTNLTSYDGAKVNDGLLSATAFVTPVTTAATLRVDLGSAKTLGAFECTITATTSSPTIKSLVTGFVQIESSSDDATYTPVIAKVSARVDSSGNIVGFYVDWDHTVFTAKRYWRIDFASSLSTYTVSEVQPLEVQATEFPYITSYELTLGTTSSSPVVLTIPASSIPTSTNQLNLDAFVTRTVVSGSIVSTFDGCIKSVGYNGQKSTGRWIHFTSSVTASAAAETIPVLRSALGETKQTGGLAFDGTYEGSDIDLAPSATGTTHLKLNSPTSQSVDMAKFQLNAVDKLTIGKDGSLKTVQASRIAPWTESVVCSTDTAITSTTVADITGATVTFTPAVNTRITVVAQFYATCTGFNLDSSGTASSFRGSLDVNGAQTGEVKWIPGAVSLSATSTGVWTIDLTGGTSYTVKLRARVNSAGVHEFSVKATDTRFVIVGVGSA